MLNLSQLMAKDHVTLPIPHPVTHEETGATITLAGSASEEYVQARTRLAQARVEKGDDWTAQDAKQLSLALLVDCVVGWSGISRDGKEAIPFSREAVEELLGDRRFYWLSEFVDKNLVDIANFIGD